MGKDRIRPNVGALADANSDAVLRVALIEPEQVFAKGLGEPRARVGTETGATEQQTVGGAGERVLKAISDNEPVAGIG
jgi:hypothetical protein